MALGTAEVGYPVNMTQAANGMVSGGTDMARTYAGGNNNPASVAETTVNQGAILGFYVNSTSSGTIVLSNATAAGGAGTAFTGTITPAVGWNYLPVVSPTGIYATFGGTINVTFICLN